MLMCGCINAGDDALCIGVDIGWLSMMWEGSGYCNTKYFCSVIVSSGRGGEVDFDGDDLSVAPRCCDGGSGGKDDCCGDGGGRIGWLMGVKRGDGFEAAIRVDVDRMVGVGAETVPGIADGGGEVTREFGLVVVVVRERGVGAWKNTLG